MARAAAVVSNPELDRLRTLAHWLDDGIRIPGTPIRFGADAIMDVVPIVGDFAGAGISAWIVLRAARLGASRATLLRMLYNVGVDALVGIVPALGVLFDAAWKANLKNVALLERQRLAPAETTAASRRFVTMLLLVLTLLIAAAAVGSYFLLRAGAAVLRHTF